MIKDKDFMIKLSGLILLSVVLPVVYLAVRYELFTKTQSISIWGLIIILIILAIFGVIIKYYLEGVKTRYSFLKQVLQGVLKVILPLIALLVAGIVVKTNIDDIAKNVDSFIETILVIIVCEFGAILINPLPKWAFDNNVEGIVKITDKILHKGE